MGISLLAYEPSNYDLLVSGLSTIALYLVFLQTRAAIRRVRCYDGDVLGALEDYLFGRPEIDSQDPAVSRDSSRRDR